MQSCGELPHPYLEYSQVSCSQWVALYTHHLPLCPSASTRWHHHFLQLLLSLSGKWCHQGALVWRCLRDVKFSNVFCAPRPYKRRENAPLSLVFHFPHGSHVVLKCFPMFVYIQLFLHTPFLEFRQEYRGRLGWRTDLNSENHSSSLHFKLWLDPAWLFPPWGWFFPQETFQYHI